MELQVGVKILLKNKEGKFLMLQRNGDKYPEVGALWDIVGGRIDKGIPLLENLKREIFEETQLTLTEEPKLISAQDILKTDKHVVRLTYVGKIEGEPVLDEDHIAYKWLTLEELKNLEPMDKYFKKILENNKIK